MVPITVFTGFVGAGKTTTILSLLPKLPTGYTACLLKNEFGDVEVDSLLAKQSSLAAVSEILNGCLCCILVGQMKNALLEILGKHGSPLKTLRCSLLSSLENLEKYHPDRIFIETSGSAFPASLAIQIRELEQETKGALKLDAIATVIDAENFLGYEDTSPTAKLQASYTDVILINKWEHVSERRLDTVMDHLHTLNDLTPKLKCDGKNGVDPNLIFGFDSKLFMTPEARFDDHHSDEIEAVTVLRSASSTNEVPDLTEEDLTEHLSQLSSEVVWRVKGFVKLASPPGVHVLNWAFSRFDITKFDDETGNGKGNNDILLNVMGERGTVKKAAKKFAALIGAECK